MLEQVDQVLHRPFDERVEAIYRTGLGDEYYSLHQQPSLTPIVREYLIDPNLAIDFKEMGIIEHI